MKAPTHSFLRNDLLLAVGLIALGVTARLLPHEPNFTPIAASALFAGTTLRTRGLAFAVPLCAMLLSDVVIGFDSSPMTLAVYALFMLPALVAYLPPRLRAPGMFAPVIVGYSLLFFAVTNFVLWVTTAMYPHSLAGLGMAYVAALPFLPQTVVGDLFWSAVLFGGAALLAMAPRATRQTT